MRGFWSIVIAVVATPAMADPLHLNLLCNGAGERKVVNGAWGSAFGKHGSASFVGGSTSQSQFEDQLDIDLTTDTPKARVPRRFLPPAHGGDGGWFEIKDLVVTDDAISGTVMINFINHPKLRVDRRSGTVNLDGKVGAYSGHCEPFDPATAKRAF